MRNDNTFGVHFILRMNKVKDDKAPIYARIVVNGSRCEISLKKKVELRDWNQSKGFAKPKSNDLKSLNNYLEEVRGQFADCYRQLHLEKRLLNAEQVKNHWLGSEKKEYTLNVLMGLP